MMKMFFVNVVLSVALLFATAIAAPIRSEGYVLKGMTETDTGFQGSLELIGDGTEIYGKDIKSLSLNVIFETEDIFRLVVTDSTQPRWEIPENVIARQHASIKPLNSKMNYKFSYTESPFTFEVTRITDGRSIFKMSNPFIFKDQYIELSTDIDENAKTFGLGESTRLKHALTRRTYTLWAADIAAAKFNVNLYGSYPFYVQMVSGAAHGALLFNSNGMDVVLEKDSLTYKTIGGIIDLYVFAGSTPASVTTQYTEIVGKPMMMPYWSLGFHNCKYGYTSIQQVEEVVANYSAAGIPLDTQWMDIDYMQNYKDFTFDAVNFPVAEVSKFVDQLHADGQHFIPIVDPGIMATAGYEAYEKGIEKGVFINDITGKGYYLGQVWPGPTYFPDFLHPSAQEYWTEQISEFHDMVKVDGLWIDMNEVSNFCNRDGLAQVCSNTAPDGCPAPGASQGDCCLECSTVDPTNTLDFPPYNISNQYGILSVKTASMSSFHYGGVSVYNAHNLYGLTEQIATKKALTEVRGGNRRPFLVTRSGFLSSGVHTAKWTGDNDATWKDLQSSVISVLDFNMFAIPMIGADICGFKHNTTEELCARWIEVGAFYPFARNHNALGSAPQELYIWESVSTAAKSALSMRYQMLPYFYTLFYEAHTTGSMVARALWANYPEDPQALEIDAQFMLGDAVLISPVLFPNVSFVNAYFPQGYWYDFAKHTFAIDATPGSSDSTIDTNNKVSDASNSGVTVRLHTPLTSTNVHVRGGRILPLQDGQVATTTAGRLTPFTLFAAVCPKGKAFGSLYWDDGEQVDLLHYFTASYSLVIDNEGGTLETVVQRVSYDIENAPVTGTLVVMAGPNTPLTKPSSVKLNGMELHAKQVIFGNKKSSLTIVDLNVSMAASMTLQWVY